ncbi:MULTISPECIES: peroxiredoxin [Actinoalloteichus]|uniref:Alkyl hydroperoxide reductase E n=1 Tax=Actinoalloteichus fjordicus TaxID=1612552 RepID=A0AAC9PUL1_9PSEU|nr:MULTISPECIES: peroxiredoxin [Actinoalloteichus]APU17076.1 Peroxiredoxin [Actinoalloteichus fjordicus]APU23157.1 Peroxiredoxin [Actinoalloteichus sp. GBA129-24]
MTLEVGTQAPDFTLNDYDKQSVTLSSFQGKSNVLLVFYPFAFSGTCTGELCQVRDELADYQGADVTVLGVSVDTTFSLKKWAGQEGYTFPLLSDFWPHGAVAQTYGVFNEAAGFANRGTFLIDKQGVIRFAERNGAGEARDQSAWKKAIAELAA